MLRQAFIAGTIAADAPVVPISAQLKYNIDAVCEYLIKKIPVPVRCAASRCRDPAAFPLPHLSTLQEPARFNPIFTCLPSIREALS